MKVAIVGAGRIGSAAARHLAVYRPSVVVIDLGDEGSVGLAVDGSASNDGSDFLGEMRQALLLQRVRYGANALSVRQVFAMATTMGASICAPSSTPIASLSRMLAQDVSLESSTSRPCFANMPFSLATTKGAQSVSGI